MSKSIIINYIWNRENVERLFEASYKYQFNHSAKRYIGWLFIALLQFGVVAALKKGAFELLLFSTIVLIYWYYGKKEIAKRRAKKSFLNSSFRDKTIHIEVNDEGFMIKGQEGKTQWKWNDIDEVVSLGDDIMLCKYPYFHYIPSNGFSSLEDKSLFKSMARAHKKILEA